MWVNHCIDIWDICSERIKQKWLKTRNVPYIYIIRKEPTHWKRPWCWEKLKPGGEGGSREWDGWMASPTQWTWVWANSGSWWWTGKPGVLQSMGSPRVGHDLKTEQQQPYIYTQVALVAKNLPAKARDLRDMGSIPGSGRSQGGGNGNPLQYSCLENPMDRGAWQATVLGVAKS